MSAHGEKLRVRSVLDEERDRLIGRACPDVVELGRDHDADRAAAAARTDFTMLW